MRKHLESVKEQRKKFRAVFTRFGKKTNYHGYSDQTVLLTNVRDAETNKVVTDHLWFAYTKGFEKVVLTPGGAIEFDARIKAYKKGYVNRRYGMVERSIDYKLSHPTRIVVVGDSG